MVVVSFRLILIVFLSIFRKLIFAFNACRFVKSNAIVITNKDTTIGIGSGQSSRLDSCEIAINKMNNSEISSLLVSRNKDINKKIKKVVGIIHLQHCLSAGIK